MDLWVCLLLFFFGGFTLDAVVPQKKDCPPLDLPNGRVRIRGGGRMAYFRCKKKFKRVGHKLAVCLSSGTWSQQTPVCVGRGCPDLGTLPDVTVTEIYKGGILQFSCPKGMRREGPQKLMCDGKNWDNQPPKCLYGVSEGCDFEDASLCGWIQDTEDDFDWTWTSGSTPTSETGPDGDHTTGSGHYIFMESSAPQKAGHVVRLISPQYSATSDDMCVNFWYHMKGPTKPNEVGDLDVLVRTEKSMSDKTDDDDDDDDDDGDDVTTPPIDVSIFHKEGYQDDDWVKGEATIPAQDEMYRIVFAATRRDSWTGDIALDDIKVFNCSEGMTTYSTTESTTMSDEDDDDDDDDGDTAPKKTTTKKPRKTTAKPTTAKPTTPKPTTTTKTTTTTTTTTTPPTTTMPTTQSTTTTTPTTTTTTPPTTTSPPTTTTTTTTTTPKPTTTKTPTTPAPTTTTEEREEESSTLTTSLSSSSTTSSSTMSTTTPYYYVDDTSTTTQSDYYYEFSSSSTDLPPSSSESSESSTNSSENDGSENMNNKDYIDANTASNSQSNTSTDKGVNNHQPSKGNSGGSSVNDYLPLIVGVTLGVAVGAVVVGVVARVWARNKRKQKELEIEEDQLNIIGSIEPSSYSYPPSGPEH